MTVESNRWVILEHLNDPKDPIGRHFDLLLEDGQTCRTWRLAILPTRNTPPIRCNSLPAHGLHWLEINKREVSGGRGFAKRFLTGFYKGELPQNEESRIRIDLIGEEWQGFIEIDQPFSRLTRTD